MEVHHHSPTARKKWTHYFWEFLMLFLAVFCGFLAENQREHYIEKHRAKQFAESLISDLRKDKAMVDTIILQIKDLVLFIDHLNSYTQNKTIDQLDNFSLASRAQPASYRPFAWNRATIDQIKNSGGLRYFSKMIVEKISDYDAFTHHLDEDQRGDIARVEDVARALSNVVDIGYPPEFSDMDPTTFSQLIFHDSLFVIPAFNQMIMLKKNLLTRDLNEVKKMVNLVLIQRPHLTTREQIELPKLKKDADLLIELLKKEYRLK